jgi:hypothetical protein
VTVPRRYTREQKDLIREISPGRYNQEIADLFNAKFGMDVTEDRIKCFKANHKIKSDVPKRRFTEDDGLFIYNNNINRDVPMGCFFDDFGIFNKQNKVFILANAKGLTNKELGDLINKTFGLTITAKQINTWKKNHNVTSGLDFRFQKGDVPFNKGKKGLHNVGGNKTSFKKGQRSRNYKSVGFERIDRDGYTLVKVQDDGPWHKRWRHKHKVVWEEKNGSIPKGYVILFADQNKRNFDLGNLILIKQRQLSVLNTKGLLHNDADLTKTGLIIADIYLKIGERKRKAVKAK